jgi:hypothetical protein
MRSIATLFLLFAAGLAPALAQGRTSASKVCNIVTVDLAVSGPRLMARCDSPATGAGGASIDYFAIHTGKEAERARLALSMLTAAKIAGRQVRIHYYSDDTTTNAWEMGCNPQDCRPIVRIELM